LFKQKFLPCKKTYRVGESSGGDQKTPVVFDERFLKEHFEVIKSFHFQSSPTNAGKDHTTGRVKTVPDATDVFIFSKEGVKYVSFLSGFATGSQKGSATLMLPRFSTKFPIIDICKNELWYLRFTSSEAYEI
jgi:hypothetical protein